MFTGCTAEVRTCHLSNTKSRTLQLHHPAQWLPIFWISQAVHIGRKLWIGADAWWSCCDVLESITAVVGELGGWASSVQVPHYTEKTYNCPSRYSVSPESAAVCTGQWKCDGTRADTRFSRSAKRTSPFKSARGRGSVQSTTGSRGVRISGSNAGYTVFRGRVKGTGYTLHSPGSPSLPLPCVTVCHQVSTGVYHPELRPNKGAYLGGGGSGADTAGSRVLQTTDRIFQI